MAVLTLLGMRDEARQGCVDTSTTRPGATDAQYNRRLNARYLQLKAATDDRIWQLNGVSAAASALGSKLIAITDQQVTEVLRAYRAATNAEMDGVELEYSEPYEISLLQEEDPTPGPPKKYALLRAAANPTSPTTIGRMTLAIHPIADDVYYFPFWAKRAPTELTADAHVPDVTDDESRAIAWMAGADIAVINGRPDLAAKMIADLSDRLQSIWKAQEVLRRPDKRPEEQVA